MRNVRTRVPSILTWTAAMLVVLTGPLPGHQAGEVGFGDSLGLTTTLNQPAGVAEGDIDGDGDLDLVVIYGVNSTSGAAWLENLDGIDAFGEPQTIDDCATGTLCNAQSLRLADMDADGDLDFVTAQVNAVFWYANDGQGGFGARQFVRNDVAFYLEIAVGDIDGDADIDVAAIGRDKIVWFANLGGSFDFNAETLVNSTTSSSFGDIELADIDGDLDLDIVTTDPSTGTRVVVYPNTDGSGSYGPLVEVIALTSTQGDIAVADVNADGDLDVVSASYNAGGGVRLIENTAGDGTLWTETGSSTIESSDLRIADLDQDGDLDVVSSLRFGGGPINWLENTSGDGTSWSLRSIGSGPDGILDVVVADLDNDGDPDAISAGFNDNTLTLFENRTIHRNALFGSGQSVGSPFSLPGISDPTAVDFDGDGDLDIVVGLRTAPGGITLLRNTGLPASGWTRTDLVTGISDCCHDEAIVDDLDGDGDLDLIIDPDTSSNINWWESDGGEPPSFTPRSFGTSLTFGEGLDIVSGDIDGDGDVDLMACDFGKLAWFDNDGGSPPIFTERSVPDIVGSTRDLKLADLDNDGDLDAVSASSSGAGLAWYENDGLTPPSFTARQVLSVTNVITVEVGDFDNDGDIDLLGTMIDNGRTAWFENMGGSPIVWVERLVTASFFLTSYAADFDGDGDLDVVTGGSGSPKTWYENLGGSPPQWAPRPGQISGSSAREWTHGDFDGDGDTDLFASASGNVISWVFENVGGQYNFQGDTFVDSLATQGEETPLLEVLLELNGRPGDPVGLWDTIALYFDNGNVASPLSSGQANALIEELRIYRDNDLDGNFKASEDVLVETVDTLNLTSGELTVTLPASDPNVRIAAPATFFITAQMTADAGDQAQLTFRITHRNVSGPSTVVDANDGIVLKSQLNGDFASQTFTASGRFVVESTGYTNDLTPGDGLCEDKEGDCTLPAAVQEANALSGDDRIFIPAGTYSLTPTGTPGLLVDGSGGRLDLVGQGTGETIIELSGANESVIEFTGAIGIQDLTITGGNATAGDGGALTSGASGCELELLNVDFVGNSGAMAGAVYLEDCVARIENSVFRDNTGIAVGSADAYRHEGASSEQTIVNSTFSGNNTGGSNPALLFGGADQAATIGSTTITGNGAGISATAGASNISVENTIIAANSNADITSDLFTSLGHNLIGATTSLSFVDGIGGDQVGTGGSPIDPGVAGLGDYGGSTLSHDLEPTSPAIDAGSCSGLTTDQRGSPRVLDLLNVANVDDACDIGALETDNGTTLAQLEVPIRWCAVRGAPSVEDPSLVGASSVNELLRGRHERATEEIYRPQANLVFRSAANDIVSDFPILDDPDCVEGPPGSFNCDRGSAGDVFIKPESGIFDEFDELIAACRAAWFEQDPTITGITAVHINRFIDEFGSDREILGIGGRAQEGDATEQQGAGRAMVVDNLYRQDLPGNPGTPPNPEDVIDRLLGHELGHAVSLRHGNGLDDDGNGILDDDDDRALGLPRFDGTNLMQYRAGTQLTAAQVSQARGHVAATVPDVEIQPLSDSAPSAAPLDQKNASVLDFGFDQVLDLANASVLDFKNASVLDFENASVLDFKNASVLDFERARLFDFKNASVLDFKNASVLDFGMNFRGATSGDNTALFATTGALPWPPPVRPDTRYYFFLDLDRNDATGAYPRDKEIPGEAPRRFPGRNNFLAQPNVTIEAGVDLIAVVELASTCPGGDCSSTSTVRVYDYNDGTGEYEEVVIPAPTPTITPVGVGLYIDNGGETVEADTIPTAITIQPEIPNSVLFAAGWGFTDPGGGGAMIPDPVLMEVVTTVECAGDILNDTTGSGTRDCQCTDCADCPDYPGCSAGFGTPQTLVDSTIVSDNETAELTFEPPLLPSCVATPLAAAEGDALTVFVTDLPLGLGTTVEVTLDGTVIGTAPTASIDAVGAVSVSVNLPVGATGDLLLSAGIEGLAPRALCQINASPSRACVDSDSDGLCDGSDADDDNDGVADGSDSAPTNALRCRDVDADGCDDCSSGTDAPGNDGADFDLDGLCDRGDPDDDNDGVLDGADGAPRNPNACGDVDGDLCDDCVINASPTPADDGPDLDGDGLCDFGDPDDDNDGTADFADCAPVDGTLAQVPVLPTLTFSSSTRVEWNGDAFGIVTTSDLLRGPLGDLPVGSGGLETCLVDDDTVDFFDDATSLAVGEGFWYLIRSSNACGVGGYGPDSNGTERISGVCP